FSLEPLSLQSILTEDTCMAFHVLARGLRQRAAVTKTSIGLAILIGLAVLTPIRSRGQAPPARSFLVIVVDGLRPDYVTRDVMPRLTALSERGVRFTAHHAVFPSVTRVNASSFVTGAYPETHGLLGNTIYISAANATRGLDTGQRENLELVARVAGP